jgi:hypothetical protein
VLAHNEHGHEALGASEVKKCQIQSGAAVESIQATNKTAERDFRIDILRAADAHRNGTQEHYHCVHRVKKPWRQVKLEPSLNAHTRTWDQHFSP